MLVMAPIVFVGIVGNQHEVVEKQLEPSLEKVGVTEMAIPDGERAMLVKHTPKAKQVVKSLHVGGVIAGQLTGKGADRSFRVIIYDAEGNLTSDLESPVGGKQLTKHNIDVFESNIADIAAAGSPAPAAAPKATRAVAKKSAPVKDEPHLTDDDAPPGMAGTSPAPAKHAPVAVADDETATPSEATTVVATAPAAKSGDVGKHGVHVRIGLLVGMVGRSFNTDPNTVKTYTSTPVGTGGVDGAIGIGSHVRLAGSFEHTIVMHTDVAGGQVTSNIGRAEGTLAYNLLHGSVELAPVVGFGERYFAVDTNSTDRTPDLQYVYVVLGATVAKQLGTRWALRGNAAFEPVVTGLRPAALPAPSRWGVDVGASLDVKATSHVFARAAVGYQMFQSSYMTGNTVDGYYGGNLSAGAMF